jgi:hypothetical protein
MRKLLVLVEGQTEETFVREVLAYHLYTFGLAAEPVLLKTKRTKVGRTFKGGVTSYQRVRNDITRLLRDTSAVAVTTMVDYYGLPTDFPGLNSRPSGTPYARVEHMQKAWADDIGDRRFIPFLILHEFEALLFTDIDMIAKVLPDYSVRKALATVRSRFESPEEIDESPTTHPSAHILRLAPSYEKPIDGPLIILEIGLEPIRATCPHLHRWIAKLETL